MSDKKEAKLSRNHLEATSKRGGTMHAYESERSEDRLVGMIAGAHQKRLQASKVQIKSSSNNNHGNRHDKHSMEIVSQNAIQNSSHYKMDVAVKSSRNIEQYIDSGSQ